MESLMINLEKPQKEALRKRAARKGSSIAAEIRQAVRLYLNGASEHDLQLSDILSKKSTRRYHRHGILSLPNH